MKIKKAIIPAAGFGTRVLPATKAIPKEMFPIVDKPAIQYIVEEAAKSGIEEILIITSRGKSEIEDHFDRAPELEKKLEEGGAAKKALLDSVVDAAKLANITFIRQQEQKGLGHAVLQAKSFVGNEPFAVLYGDDVIIGEDPCIGQLMRAYEETGLCGAVGIKEVSKEDVQKYSEIYSQLVAKKNEIAELERSLEDRSMMTDILKYQISDIEKARIQDPSEEEKLEKLRTKIKSIEQVTKNANLVYRALAPGEKGASASYLLERAAAALRQLSDVMDNAEELAQKLDEYRYELIDIAEQARDVIDGDDVGDPEKQLDIIESRLAAFSRLKKKYGGTLEDVISFRDDAKRKLRDLEGGEDRMEELRLEYRNLAKKATVAADIISEKRREAGERLAEEVMATLKSLDMPKVRFFVDIRKTQGDDKFNPRGTDEVDLQ